MAAGGKMAGRNVAIKMWRKWRESLFGEERYGGKKDFRFRRARHCHHEQHTRVPGNRAIFANPIPT